MDKVVVMGQGYVGLPLAVRSVEAGFDVVGYDVDVGRVKLLQSGESYVADVTAQRLAAALSTGRYLPTSVIDDVAGFDVAVISVPTPLRDGLPDLDPIVSASRSLAPFVTRESTVVLESTTYPGTTEELVRGIVEDGCGLCAGEGFHLGYSPERIDPGNPDWRLENTPKIVSGIDAASLRAVERFFARVTTRTVAVNSPREAELAKLIENTFRHVNIALINELAMFAYDLGIDVWQAIEAAGTKPFGYMKFMPGPGVGGHCLPIDPSYLSWQVKRELGQSFRFVELANDINDHMPDYVVRRVQATLNRKGLAVRGRRILMLGLSYKRNSGDVRESPALAISRRLLALGADVLAADPHVEPTWAPPGVVRVEATEDELRSADLVVLLVDHDAFDHELTLRCARQVLDTRHSLPPAANVESL